MIPRMVPVKVHAGLSLVCRSRLTPLAELLPCMFSGEVLRRLEGGLVSRHAREWRRERRRLYNQVSATCECHHCSKESISLALAAASYIRSIFAAGVFSQVAIYKYCLYYP